MTFVEEVNFWELWSKEIHGWSFSNINCWKYGLASRQFDTEVSGKFLKGSDFTIDNRGWNDIERAWMVFLPDGRLVCFYRDKSHKTTPNSQEKHGAIIGGLVHLWGFAIMYNAF